MPAALLLCLVVAIADGDTLTARCGEPGAYEQVKVRISAIDAPEKRQPFGTRSRQALGALCHEQQATIRVRDRDRYGRSVADVSCRGQDVATSQVRAGMAWVYDRYAKGYEALYELQDGARAGRRGLWADLRPVAPREWRHGEREDRADGRINVQTGETHAKENSSARRRSFRLDLYGDHRAAHSLPAAARVGP